MKKLNLIYQFQITLEDTSTTILRKIQVPENYTFWDLHVAIQDSMGWADYHLHAFRLRPKHKKKDIEIGIPDDEFNQEVLPGWEVYIKDIFHEVGTSVKYEYDFGDGWNHTVVLEGILLKDENVKYPICIAGKGSCPPEDCGGPPGYERLLEIIKDPSDPEYQEIIEWLKGHVKNYYPYKPNHFECENVIFENPKKRWKIAFSDNEF